jgi:hypothetical protein
MIPTESDERKRHGFLELSGPELGVVGDIEIAPLSQALPIFYIHWLISIR